LNPSAENFYAVWRNQSRATDVLRDENGFPNERLLQAVWRHQRLRRDQLKTSDGQAVRVLHPGFASAEGGPDFRGAVIQTGGEAPRSGDVEIDLRSHNWRAHGHDRNPNFKNVILHVVWETGAPATGAAQNERPLTLPINNSLDAPLGELSVWLENESASSLPENLRGQCSAPLRELDESQLAELLRQAARVRLESKAAQFSARARHAGWAGFVGRAVPRARLQTQRLADAKSGGIAPALVVWRKIVFCISSTAAWRQRPVAGGIDPVAKKFGHLFAPRLGLLVA
jgi:hypothetical protein